MCYVDANMAGNEIKRFTGHSATVNELSLDMAGEFIASCSDDGMTAEHPCVELV